MNLSARQKLLISITAIIFYWLYSFLISSKTVPHIPSDIGSLFLQIMKTKIIVFTVLFLFLRLEGDSFGSLGFTTQNLLKQIGMALAFGAGIWIAVHIIFQPIIKILLPEAPAQAGTDMTIFMKDLVSVGIWMPIIVIGTFVEELERIFMLTRFEKWLGKNGIYIALILSSVAFGIGHLYQGLNTAIGTGLGGLLYGLVYLRKRSAWEAVLAHAFFDIISIIIGYLIATS